MLLLNQAVFNKTLALITLLTKATRTLAHQTISLVLALTKTRIHLLKLPPRNQTMSAALKLQAKCLRSKVRKKNQVSVPKFKSQKNQRVQIILRLQ
jgi:hypothetical protein